MTPTGGRPEPGDGVAPEPDRWRTLGLYLLLLGLVGTLCELTLLGHYESAYQWAPIALLGAGVVVVVGSLVRPGRGSLSALRVVMALYLPAAAAGLYFHLRSNVEFELEMRPSMAGLELARESLTGAIPALAPGALAQLGLLGLLICFRNPALRPPATGMDQHEATTRD